MRAVPWSQSNLSLGARATIETPEKSWFEGPRPTLVASYSYEVLFGPEASLEARYRRSGAY